MAQAKKQAKTQARAQDTAPIIGGDDPDEKFEAFADEDATLQKIFAELDQDEGASWLVSVHSVPATGGKAEYLFQCDPSQLEGLRDRLRDEFGTGTYIARVKRNGQVRGVIWFRIRALPNRAPLHAPAQPSPELTAIMEALKQQNAALLLLAQRSAQPVPAAQPTSLKELVETMVSLRALTAEGQGQSGINLIMEGIKLAKELKTEDREPGLLEMLLQSPIVQRLLQAAATARAPGAIPPQLPQPETRPVPAQPSARAEVQAGTPAADPMLVHLRFLLDRAKADDDPALYAYVVRDVLPPDVLPQLLAAGPNAIGFFVRAVPEIDQYRSWFAELLDSLKQIMADDAGLPGTVGSRADGGAPEETDTVRPAGRA